MTFLTAAGTALAHAGTLAASPKNSTSTVNDVEPGVLAFLIVAAMGIALVFLLRSMNKQFRKIGPKPEDDLLDMAELAKLANSPADEPDEADQAPENVVPGEVVPDATPRRQGSVKRPAQG